MSLSFSFCFKQLLQPAQNVLPAFASLHGALTLVSPRSWVQCPWQEVRCLTCLKSLIPSLPRWVPLAQAMKPFQGWLWEFSELERDWPKDQAYNILNNINSYYHLHGVDGDPICLWYSYLVRNHLTVSVLPDVSGTWRHILQFCDLSERAIEEWFQLTHI